MEDLREIGLISVIIPTYNNERTILKALNSVFCQTYQGFEVIVINDGSTDLTSSIIKEVVEMLPEGLRKKLSYVEKQNSGPSDTRNMGISISKGEFIAFLDADDYWFPNKLEIQLNYFKKFPEVALISTAFGYKRLNEKIEYKIISLRRLLISNLFSTPSVMMRKSIIGDIEFNSYQRYSEDYRLWLHIATKNKCMYINEVLTENQLNKGDFGDSGLSSNLWGMTKGEMSNYIYLYKNKKIGRLTLGVVISYSYLKYTRRYILVQLKKIRK